jgi:plastocyanin
MNPLARRHFLQLAAFGGVTFASGLRALARGEDDFYFVQLSDSHWGFEGAPNPDARGTLPKAIEAVNALREAPDFVIFTGDLTHTTDDPRERRRRMAEFREIAGRLSVKTVRFIPGEHDASLDNGRAFQELFGPTHYSFDHKGVHFIALDNVSDPSARLGDEQLRWLAEDLKAQPAERPIVVFAHRPLFDLYPAWDWATRDGDQAIALLTPHRQVTVFYGHIHQEHHHSTGHIAHHSAKSLIFPLPAPGSQPKRVPVAWDPAQPYRGLGWREVEAQEGGTRYEIAERPVRLATAAGAQASPRTIDVVARKFEFVPAQIRVRQGETVLLRFTAPEVPMGASFPDFGVRTDIVPGKTASLQLKADKPGRFTFLCDVFCGSGHEDMSGTLIVEAGAAA